jgi:hypothetical protein
VGGGEGGGLEVVSYGIYSREAFSVRNYGLNI